VQKAFELSIDRDAINQVVFNGEFIVGNQWVSPENPYYQKDFPAPKRDIAKAKALMKEAGITKPLVIDFMVNNAPEARAISEMVQAMAAEAGFDLRLRVTEVATALKAGEDGDFQLYGLTWSGRSDPDGNSVVFQTCGAPQNMGKYCDKEVDAWYQDARAASDFEARKAIYRKITERFLDKGWIMFIYHPKNLVAHTARLEGLRKVPDGILRVVDLKLK
jgi:peptide/nickel transport system substrate-binding protein